MKTALLQTVPAVIGRTENQVAALHDQEDPAAVGRGRPRSHIPIE